MKKALLIWLLIIWGVLVIGSFAFNYLTIVSSNNALVINESRAFFEQVLVTRQWNSQYGGVYVPVTDITQPNPYLKDSLKDLITTNGLRLTKINPAYMTRQIAEIGNAVLGNQFNITSLKPIRPDNKADEWEVKALTSFENGEDEYSEFTKFNGEPVFRYMAPLVTQKSCLSCHAVQGYKEGDIRGGISILTPTKTHFAIMNAQITRLAFFHAIFLILGVIGIYQFYKRNNRYFYELEQKNIQLKSLNQTRDRMFSIIAHDLKSPLSTIFGISNLLTCSESEMDVGKKHYLLKTIGSTSQITINLLDNLLEWAKTQTGSIKFTPQIFELKPVIENVVDIVTPAASLKNIRINLMVEDSRTVYADKNMLDTVLRNLVSNAIKFTHTDGTIDIKVNFNCQFTDITIADNGVGMNSETTSKLFKSNGGFTTIGTNNETGSGLGLSLCKDFVHRHGGKIWVESEVGKGSAFSFKLPSPTPNTEKLAKRITEV